jgi:hypothetical protein
MDQNEKLSNDKISKLESEIKVLKNEVQAVLLDLRESYLNVQNPFNSAAGPAASVQPIVINQQAPAQNSGPEPRSKEDPKEERTTANQDSRDDLLPIAQSRPQPEPKEPKLEPRWHAELEPISKPKLDLVTVAGLTGWVEESTKKMGRERAEAVLDISEVMGYVTAELKPIILKLIALAPPAPAESSPRTRDYIDSLIQINSLLGKDNREETALLLLSLVSGEKNHG